MGLIKSGREGGKEGGCLTLVSPRLFLPYARVSVTVNGLALEDLRNNGLDQIEDRQRKSKDGIATVRDVIRRSEEDQAQEGGGGGGGGGRGNGWVHSSSYCSCFSCVLSI